MDVTVSNVTIVQRIIFHWNSWSKNWIKRVWSSGGR